MKYFTKEIWADLNSNDDRIRAQAEKVWIQNSQQYQKEFEKTQRHIPKRFLKEFLCRNQFHDYQIIAIVFNNKNDKKCLCELHLTDGTEMICLTMRDIKRIRIDIDSFDSCVKGKLAWGYSEIELTNSNSINLSLICDIQNELQFECKSIVFSKK